MLLEPSSRIAATSRSSAFLDVVVIGLDGRLYNTFLTTATGIWTALRQIGGTPPKLAHVSTACCRGTGDVEVLAVARDGSVWATHRDSTLPDCLPMQRLTLLDLTRPADTPGAQPQEQPLAGGMGLSQDSVLQHGQFCGAFGPVGEPGQLPRGSLWVPRVRAAPAARWSV
ncbi:hypothetical protein [Streptomyces sp. NPDC059378]|uniref:hypothetical protein n=1 Tax=Streptomyces sp. NPDC059378 TaxID=3346815 RepID=UPI00367E3CCB